MESTVFEALKKDFPELTAEVINGEQMYKLDPISIAMTESQLLSFHQHTVTELNGQHNVVITEAPVKKVRKVSKPVVAETPAEAPAVYVGSQDLVLLDPNTTKKCPKCGIIHSVVEFGKDGKRSYCRKCNSLASQASRAKHLAK
jgi:hypothetical protein